MERADFLRKEDQVSVTILGPDNSRLYDKTTKGLHNINSAIQEALEDAHIEIDPEELVFVVDNITTGVSHRYRINAHGNIKLIV
ncbi:MAG: hypothetical protein J1F38_09190 [Muribaculaceae bacterium]|nr:hypothetical protein [Muribaculaceae bacterium]